MQSQQNPYTPLAPLGPGDPIAGRRETFRWIEENLSADRRVLFFYGRSKIGKTSLLNHLPNRLYSRYIPALIMIEPERRASFRDLLSIVMSGIGSGLPPTRGVSLPRVTREQLDAEGDYVQDVFIPIARHALADHCLVLCLDGLSADDLALEPVIALLEYLRQLVHSEQSLALLITVRGRRDAAPTLGWAEDTPSVELGNLSKEETEELVTGPGLRALAYDYDSVRRVYAVTSGHPYVAQLVAHSVYERRSAAGWVGAPHIDAAVNELLELGDEELERMWSECSPPEQAILSVLGHLRGWQGTVSPRDVGIALRRLKTQASIDVIVTVLDQLASLGILRKLSAHTYRFGMEMFRLWVRQNTKPRELLRGDRRFRRIAKAEAGAQRNTINWTAVAFWGLALALVGLIALAWQSRDRLGPETTPIPGFSSVTAQPSSVLPLVPSPTAAEAPSLSSIAYMSKEHAADTWEIWSMRIDGSDPRQLTRNDADDTSPSWSPDGKGIAFVTDRDGNREIYVMQADGNEQINLTAHPAEDSSPSWSPDGASIAFASYRDGNWEIYIMDVDGGDPVRLTTNDTADYSPCWSPDGSQIAYASRQDGNWEIYTMQRNGTTQGRLTFDEATDFAPYWSPDGSRIAFESYRDGNMEIYVVSPDGSGLANVTDASTTDDHGPSWDPTGEKIAFFSNRDGGWDIFSMKADGTGKANLTLSQSADQSPAWSP